MTGLPQRGKGACARLMIGSGADTYDPICELPEGHAGSCKSTGAVDQHRLERWVVALQSEELEPCSACGTAADVLYRRYGEFDLARMYCADCSIGQDPTAVVEE